MTNDPQLTELYRSFELFKEANDERACAISKRKARLTH